MTREQIEEGVLLGVKRIYSMLIDVEILCKNKGSEASAVTLYTVGVEEYGKILLLKLCLKTSPDKGQFRVKKLYFGIGGGHQEKFDAALNDLPEECQYSQRITLLEDMHKIPPKYRKNATNFKGVAEKMSRKLNLIVESYFSLVSDFELRKNLLYLDWDDERKRWWPTLEVEPYKVEYGFSNGYEYDPKLGAYIKTERRNGRFYVSVSSCHPNRMEVELPEEEVFPDREL